MEKARKSAADKVYKEIRNAITFSRFKPGERLLEKTLCEAFNVSRTPLREALRQLQAQGYITVERNRGAIVKKTSIAEVEELYSILSLLEPYSAAKAAAKRTKRDIARLTRLFEHMSANLQKDDHRLWVKDNDEFHHVIHTISRSQVLLETIYNLRNRLYRFRILMLTKGNVDTFAPQHKEILDAIIGGDSEAAEQYMKNHMLCAKKGRVEFLKTYPELL
jgi:DNA-binding GntR family transcriptional regulator